MTTQQRPRKLLMQMSGAPGSGKSTLARLLSRSTASVVIDHDVLRSSLLESNIPFGQAAKHAYTLQWTLAHDIMKQGFSIIIDSTCNFPEVLDQGLALARQHSYAYWYIECKVHSIDLLDQRLRTRDPMASQRTTVDHLPAAARDARAEENPRALFRKWMEESCQPKENVITVDSTGDPESLRDYVLKRIVD